MKPIELIAMQMRHAMQMTPKERELHYGLDAIRRLSCEYMRQLFTDLGVRQ